MLRILITMVPVLYIIIVPVGSRGSVGQAAMQVTRFMKARPIGLVSKNPPQDQTDVVDTSVDDVKQKVLALTNGNGADVIIDTVGNQELFEKV